MTDIILAAILSLARPPAVDVHAESVRLVGVADAIARAVGDATELPFAGPAAPEATALALVAIAFHESGFAADVQACRRNGDPTPRDPAGASISLWQLMRGRSWWGRTRAEICGSVEVAAGLAIRTLALHAGRSTTALGAWEGYASGSPGRGTRAARTRCETWTRLATRAGIEGASCWRRAPLSRPDPAAGALRVLRAADAVLGAAGAPRE